MAGGVTLQVRQIGSYPLETAASGGDLLLVQPGGLGNPYASVAAATLVGTALSGGAGPLGVGVAGQPSSAPDQVFTGQLSLPTFGRVLWNCYLNSSDVLAGWSGGLTAAMTQSGAGLAWGFGAASGEGQPANIVNQMTLSPAGALSLPFGTLTVARDPGSALEVATMGWVGNNTVASFNGRRGVVQLTSADIYAALCLDSTIATQAWVCATIQASVEMLLANHPFVFGWNGRTGAVYLTLADISCVFFQPGQQPITPTPPATSDDYSIANTAWVTQYVQSEFAGTGGLATQAWVLANTVNTFNGRYGVVILNTADITGAGGAPINSPQFTGAPQAPTAPPGQATGQLATTAFVQQAIVQNTTGVVSFNTRTGAITLDAADINDAGGALLASPAFTGTPTAPTAPTGTNDTQIATTAFVLQEVSAIGAGVLSFNGRSGVVTLTLGDIEGAGGAPLASPNFTGNPTVPTPASPVAATTSAANTNWVVQYNALNTVASFNGRIGAVTLSAADILGAGALVNPSPALTGTPTAPTQAPTDNSTAIATTAYVHAALTNFGGVLSFNTRTGAVTLSAADLTGAGGALLASPVFTGTPSGPTAAPGTSTTQLATTAFVAAAIASSGVSSFNGRTGAVTLTLADITGAGGAPLANPAFSGVPTAPTAPPGTNTTQLATTAFVQAALGGYLPLIGGTLTGALTAPNITATTAFAVTATATPSTFAGSVQINGGINATGGNIVANGHNVVAQFAGDGAAHVCYNTTAGGACGIYITASGTQMTLGAVSASGTPITNWMNFNGSGMSPVSNDLGQVGWPGSAFSNMAAYAFNTQSDPRQKQHIVDAPEGALAAVNAITVKHYHWLKEAAGDRLHIGWLASDVQAVVPELATVIVGDDEEKTLALNTMEMTAILWKAVQELSAEVAALKGAAA